MSGQRDDEMGKRAKGHGGNDIVNKAVSEMDDKRIVLSHGDGGSLTRDLINTIFLPLLSNSILSKADDSALIPLLACDAFGVETTRAKPSGFSDLCERLVALFRNPSSHLAFTTDSFVVDPIFFPGGDIGKLAVYGTLNDLWVSGAIPLFISAGFIIEEGMPFSQLQEVVQSMKGALTSENVLLVTGDTKVVPKGKGDKIFINTSGVGVVPKERIMKRRAQPGQKVLVSGTIAEHGTAVLACRMGIKAKGVMSDCGPLGPQVERLFSSGATVAMMRDPTRGGLATVLEEIAHASCCDIYIDEDKVPVKPEVKEICDLLGLDPLYLACEGRAVAIVDGKSPLPSGWVEIGQVVEGKGESYLRTLYGGTRRLGLLEGTPLPRIC